MSVTRSQQQKNGKPNLARRPIRLLVLIFAFLLLSLFGWLRFQQSLAMWNILILIEIWPGPFYLAAGGFLWGVIGLVVGLGLFFAKPWATRWSRRVVLLLASWYWLDRLVLVRSEAAQTNVIFMALLTVMVLVYTYFVSMSVDRARNEGLSN